jgi:ABC-type transporter Mla subunit MlaD
MAALVAAIVAVVVIVSSSIGGSYLMRARFQQVYGLVDSADVVAGGLTVGHVVSIGLGRDGMPVVTMSIDNGFPLRQGARANLRAFSLTGENNTFISLTPGSGMPLPAGSELGFGQTDQPVEIYQALDTLDPRTRAAVRATLAGLDASFAGQGSNLRAALAHSAAAVGNTAALLAEVNSQGAALHTFVSQGSRLVSTLAQNPGSLGATAENLASVLRSTAARQGSLTQIAQMLPAGLRSPRLALSKLDGSIATLRRLVTDATPGVAELVPFAHDLEPVLGAAPPALAQALSLVRAGPRDANSLSELIRTARPQLPVLGHDLEVADPILDQLRVRLPDLFSFFANWADFTSDFDANGHAARVGLVFPPAPATSIGGCSAAQGSLAYPFQRAPGVLGGQPWANFSRSFIGGGSRDGSGGCR